MSDRSLVTKTAAILLAVVWAACMPTASAQSGETDVGELSGYGGGLFGVGTRFAAGGSAGIALSRYSMVLIDTSYMSLGRHTIQSWPAQSAVRRSNVLDFGVDFHIRIPVRDRWAPYAILGTGLLWNMVQADAADANGAPLVRGYDQFNAALHTGGGVRYYIGRNWGIRPEVKVIVSKQTYTMVTLGLFWVTPTEWP